MTGILPVRPQRVLLLGGTSEIGLAVLRALRLAPGSEVILAGRDPGRLAEAGRSLAGELTVSTAAFEATEPGQHQELIAKVFAQGAVDIAISATGVLVPQRELDADPELAATLAGINFTGHVSALLALAGQMRAAGHGTLVVLSSVAAVRPRRANPVYGAAKAGLDAFARGLADRLHGSGVRVLLVRPGFVIGRMTAGMPPAPLATTPEEVGRATAAALLAAGSGRRRPGRDVVWVPGRLALLATALRLVPRPLWRRLDR